MFVFSSIGIPVVALLFSFFTPPTTSANATFHFQERRMQRVVKHPTLPVTPTPLARPVSPLPIANPSLLQPTLTPTSTSQQTETPIPTAADVKQAFIMKAINDYRTSHGLSPVQTNASTCNFAKIRAQEIANNFNHDGFNQRIQSHMLPYPNYSLVTENIAETGNYQEVVTMWENSPGHAANMRADTPYVCVEEFGDYYAYEGWSGTK